MIILTTGPLGGSIMTTGTVIAESAALSTTAATVAAATSSAAIVGTSNSYMIPIICITNPWFCIGVGAEEVYESLLSNHAGDSLLGVNAIDGIL